MRPWPTSQAQASLNRCSSRSMSDSPFRLWACSCARRMLFGFGWSPAPSASSRTTLSSRERSPARRRSRSPSRGRPRGLVAVTLQATRTATLASCDEVPPDCRGGQPGPSRRSPSPRPRAGPNPSAAWRRTVRRGAALSGSSVRARPTDAADAVAECASLYAGTMSGERRPRSPTARPGPLRPRTNVCRGECRYEAQSEDCYAGAGQAPLRHRFKTHTNRPTASPSGREPRQARFHAVGRLPPAAR